MAGPSPCPAREELEAFLLGGLPDDRAEPLEEHLLQCGRCQGAAASFQSGDTVTNALRAVGHAAGAGEDDEAVAVLVRRLKAQRPAATPPAACDTTAPGVEIDADLLAPLAPAQEPGELGRLGRYRVFRLLGAGGMGVVFEAEDTGLGRRVALKVLRPALAATAGARKRFLREARTMAAVAHEHLVDVYDVGEDRGFPFLAMPLLEGESLEERLQREPRLPVSEVLRIGREIAQGLAAAHERGLVHRDIKPANVFLVSGGVVSGEWSKPHRAGRGSPDPAPHSPLTPHPSPQVKVLDFGLARAVDQETRLTGLGAIAGTPEYMAPEQVNSSTVDGRADLFSLGCVLYRMATGRLPFTGKNPMAVLLSLTHDRPVSPQARRPDLPPALAELVMRLLSKEPGDRPPSARAVAGALEDIERAPLPAPRPWWRRRTTQVAVAAGLLLVGGALLLPQVILRLKSKDGNETTIAVPEGSKIQVTGVGDVTVEPPASARQPRNSPAVHGAVASPPAPAPRDLARLRGFSSRPSVTWREYRTAQLPCGIALRVGPAVQARLRPGNAAVVIVLDCSGSMAYPQQIDSAHLLRPDTPCKFKDALDALERVLHEMERGTTVSVWIFSDKNGGSANESIREIYAPTSWTGSQEQLDQLMARLRPPALQPWNFTPLVRALWKVKNEGFRDKSKLFKTMIVLTDGADTEFDKDQELQKLHWDKLKNLPRKKWIPVFLEQEFKNAAVKINLAGFQVAGDNDRPSAEAEKEVKQQFGIVEKKLGGHLFTSRNVNQLAADLRKAMQRELKFYLEREDGGELPPGFQEGWPVGPILQQDSWAMPLPPGSYRLRVPADRLLQQRVHLEPGDFLLATVNPQGDGAPFARVLQGDRVPRANVEAAGWLLAAQQNGRRADGAAQLLLTVENARDAAVTAQQTLRQLRPRALWLEVGAHGGADAPRRLDWGGLPGYAAPALDVLLPDWGEQTGRGGGPVVWAWANWQDDPVQYCLEVSRHTDFEVFFGRPEHRVVVVRDARQVAIESVTVAPHDVQAGPGDRRRVRQSCLVVQLRYAKGEPVWADPIGLSVQGREHHFDLGAGTYTGLFWPLTREEVQRKLRMLALTPVNEFKEQRTTHYFELDLGQPGPTSVRPEPVYQP